MDAKPILIQIAEAFYHAKLRAVMIGNAAAAIQGAPVTTLDIDFAVKDEDETPVKLKNIAKELNAEFISYGNFYQIQAPEQEIYIDFITYPIGIKSFEKLFENSSEISFDGLYSLHIASLEDIVKSKKKSGQEKDFAVLSILEKTLKIKKQNEKKNRQK